MTLTFTLTIYLLIIFLIVTPLIHALLYNMILKEIRNYLQYDTNATKNFYFLFYFKIFDLQKTFLLKFSHNDLHLRTILMTLPAVGKKESNNNNINF